MIDRRYTIGLLLVALCATAAEPARAQTDFSKFPLIKAVPADAFIVVAAKANPERKFLDDYWADVHAAFMESGVLNDLWEMLTDSVSEEKLDAIEELKERFSKLCEKVQWSELFSKEMIYAGRFIVPIAHGSPYEGLVMGRMDGEKAAANYAALKGLLAEFVKLVETDYGEGVLTLTETNEDGVKMATLAHRDLAGLVLSIANDKDVIALSFGGPTLLNESMMLLQGSAKKKGMLQASRFKKAFAELPPAEDSLVFFDPSMLFTRLGGMIKMMAGAKEAKSDQESDENEPSEEKENGKAAVAAISKLLEDVSLFDCIATVEYTEGHRVFTDSLANLKVDAKNKPLYPILAGGKHSEEFSKFIPKEAHTFSVSSGISFKALYGYIRTFIESHVPGGKDGFVEFDRLQKEDWEIDLENNLIDVLEGPWVSFSTDHEWLFMLKVSNEKKISKVVNDLFKKANDAMGEQNALILTPVEVSGDRKFTQISHPMMMMMGGLNPPVWGCADGYLIVGSSAKAVDLCLKTAEGKHPNITKNRRWAEEAMRPKSGDVDAISFTDEANFAGELQQAIGGMSMGLGMAGMMGMQNAPPQIRSIFQTIPGILAKLGPVAGKLDFYQSSSEMTTFDGQRWLTKKVQNYKDPAERAKAKASDSGDEETKSAHKKAAKKRPVKKEKDEDSGDE